MRNPLQLLAAVIILFIAGCSGADRYITSYRPSYGTFNDDNAYMIDHSGDPMVIFTKEFEDDLKILTDDNFAIVGKSIFSAPPADIDEAIKLGKDLKVTHVLLSTDYIYSSSKKAFKFAQSRTYYRSYDVVNGTPLVRFESMPDSIAIPYRKEVPIFKQQAAFLVKLKN